MAVTGYGDIIPLMGNNIYWIVAITILLHIVAVYIMLKKIFKYLLSGRYWVFVGYIFLFALLFTVIPNIVYYSYIDGFNIFSESALIDSLSNIIIYILCISGVIIPVFLRSWIVSTQQLNQLRIKQESSLVEQLKEQINPAAFFKILNRSGSLVKSEPDKSSAMLIKLGQLLRYQLYDCNRKEVLLTAEISFLKNFLELEKLYSPKFEYTIITSENITGIFIPPSIFLPYVQCVVNVFNNEEQFHVMNIRIDNQDKSISVFLDISGIDTLIMLQNQLLKVQERLNMLYKDHYELTVFGGESVGEAKVSLKLDKK